MGRFTAWLPSGAVVLLGGALAIGPTLRAQSSPATGGDGTLVVGTWPNRLLLIDEATERVKGEIPLQAKYAPGFFRRSPDGKRLYIPNSDLETIEIVDLPSHRSLDVFRLGEGRSKARVLDAAPDPLGRYLAVFVKPSEKRPDHFAIGPNAIVIYDLQQHRITRSLPWPDDNELEGVGLVFSPDGKFLYLLSEDVVILDTDGFKEVGRWELSRPLEPGMGRFDFAATDDELEEPGFYTGLFRAEDPVQHRSLMGVGRINLLARTVDFFTVGPSQSRVTFALAPGRERAYGVARAIGHYELWTFDLVGRRLASRAEFAGRPRIDLKVSSNGKLLYLYTAGNTIDLYDAATYAYLRTITLDGDTTTQLMVFKDKI
ncbi:MAG: hypothetical protein U0Q12_08680 [Vicinamibacterales bacterium]